MVLKEDKEFAGNGKQKGIVREETNAVFGTTVMRVHNQHPKPPHPLCHRHPEVEVRREKGARRGRPTDSIAKTSLKVLALNYLVTIGILAECQFYKSESGCKFGAECSFPNWKGGDKSAAAIVKSVRQLSCVSQDTEPPESVSISRKDTQVLGPIRRERFTKASQGHANIREN